MNIIAFKWVCHLKWKVGGSIERHKTRLVAKGFHQQPGLNYTETYSPVVKPQTIRLILSLVVNRKWHVRQLNIQNAFLHEDLTEFVYMSQPQGFVHSQFPHHLYYLWKAIYGLKQSPHSWFSKLSNPLLALGFSSSKADTSWFIYWTAQLELFILIYVDNILVMSLDSARDWTDSEVSGHATQDYFPCTW